MKAIQIEGDTKERGKGASAPASPRTAAKSAPEPGSMEEAKQAAWLMFRVVLWLAVLTMCIFSTVVSIMYLQDRDDDLKRDENQGSSIAGLSNRITTTRYELVIMIGNAVTNERQARGITEISLQNQMNSQLLALRRVCTDNNLVCPNI